jgi:hypothetical protein
VQSERGNWPHHPEARYSPQMGRFEVRVVNRNLTVFVHTVELAYRWLDEHAGDDDTYVISSLETDGTRRPIVRGGW